VWNAKRDVKQVVRQLSFSDIMVCHRDWREVLELILARERFLIYVISALDVRCSERAILAAVDTAVQYSRLFESLPLCYVYLSLPALLLLLLSGIHHLLRTQQSINRNLSYKSASTYL